MYSTFGSTSKLVNEFLSLFPIIYWTVPSQSANITIGAHWSNIDNPTVSVTIVEWCVGAVFHAEIAAAYVWSVRVLHIPPSVEINHVLDHLRCSALSDPIAELARLVRMFRWVVNSEALIPGVGSGS